LFLDPSYKFDAFDTPSRVVELAKKERTAIEDKNKQLASIKTSLEDDTPKKTEDPVKLDLFAIDKKPHVITTLFPLGLNHYYLNAPIRGGIYLSLQVLGISSNIAAFWWKQSYLNNFGSSHLKNPQYQGRFETAQMIQYIALGAMLSSYAVSVIDALIRFQFADPKIAER
jgi:hypothetical protein